MSKTALDPIVRAAAVAAAFAVSACATAKPAPAKVSSAAVVAPRPLADAVAASPAAAVPPSAVVPMPTMPLTRIGGVVVSADAAARTLTIKDYNGRTRTFRVAGNARFTKGGDESAVQLSDLAAGDRVRLKVGGDVAANVHVMVKPAS